jgi:type IV pilus assembly protein PilE
LTVVAVLAILSTFAVSTYRAQLLRANRTDGRQLLLRIQVAEEKFFLQNSTYTANIAGAPPAGLGLSNTSPGGFYTFAVAPGDVSNPGGTIATSFTVTATVAGTQAADLATCHVMTIDDQGQRTPNDATGCWK